jgi:hypothetical protein
MYVYCFRLPPKLPLCGGVILVFIIIAARVAAIIHPAVYVAENYEISFKLVQGPPNSC